MNDEDDKKASVTQLIDRMALKAGLDEDERKTMRDTLRDNSAAGRDYKALKAHLISVLKQIISKWYTYPILASGGGGVAYFLDCTTGFACRA